MHILLALRLPAMKAHVRKYPRVCHVTSLRKG